MTRVKNLIQVLAIVSTAFFGETNAQNGIPSEKSLTELREDAYRNQGYSKVQEFEERTGVDLYLKSPDSNVVNLVSTVLSNVPASLKKSVPSIKIDTLSKVKGFGAVTDGTGIEFYSTNKFAENLYHELTHSWLIHQPDVKSERILSQWKNIANFDYGEQHTLSGRRWRDSPVVNLEEFSKERDAIKNETLKIEEMRNQIAGKYRGVIESGIAQDRETFDSYTKAAQEFEAQRSKLRLRISEYNAKVRDSISIDAKSKEPRHGLVSPYASTSPAEDMAEVVRVIFTEPPQAKELMTNPDARYKQKMEFLSKEVDLDLKMSR